MPYTCSSCHKEVAENVKFCPECGARFSDVSIERPVYRDTTRRDYAYSEGGREKNPGVALILALLIGLFFIFGVGHFYAGSIGRGFIFLIVGLILDAAIAVCLFIAYGYIAALVVGVAWFAIWIIQIVDAYEEAKRFNYNLNIHK